MKTYRVIWEIDIEAKSPRDAAKKALEIQRNGESIALVFKVFRWFQREGSFDIRSTSQEIDLTEIQ